MDESIHRLKELLDGSDNIVFFGGAGVSTESAFPISAAWTGCTARSSNTRRRLY